MGEWTILERLLEAAVQQHSTMIGRILLTVVVIFRILIVAIVGETVYEDEQTMFMCNTLQPGCNQACYDKAFPISHIRYWVFQIILVCTPSLCFITYSVHQAAKQRERRCSFLAPLLEPRRHGPDGATPAPAPRHEPEGTVGTATGTAASARPPRSAKAKRQEGISRFYVIQVVFRRISGHPRRISDLSLTPHLSPLVPRWCPEDLRTSPNPSPVPSCPGGVQEDLRPVLIPHLSPRAQVVSRRSQDIPNPSPVPSCPGGVQEDLRTSQEDLRPVPDPSPVPPAQVVSRRSQDIPNPSPVPSVPRWCSGGSQTCP
ncbi:gap junction delta-2 protein-like isoform X1 [Taeniopygia guttata]|uniref:gap junction delta-2 protein-like isoform X1 n=1 Tax=Taeniopygia guttata TaxID=59729 RepID=UPI003BB8DC3B